MAILTDRQEKLLELLRATQTASLEQIVSRFQVSSATAYRDIRALVEAGLAVKTSRGLKIAPFPEATPPMNRKCYFCSAPVSERTAFILQMQDGSQLNACCPHCGLMALSRVGGGVQSALTSDFIYGRMVNARQAVYLLESSVNLCCEPTVLSFASESDAHRFQLGYGGCIFLLDKALIRLQELMQFHS
jgi:DeoR family transcriptional regulator, copper-sensing transcriptional repressor